MPSGHLAWGSALQERGTDPCARVDGERVVSAHARGTVGKPSRWLGAAKAATVAGLGQCSNLVQGLSTAGSRS